jgi:hypothetical protein
METPLRISDSSENNTRMVQSNDKYHLIEPSKSFHYNSDMKELLEQEGFSAIRSVINRFDETEGKSFEPAIVKEVISK